MNIKVRKYLIDKARQDAPVYYSDVVKDCELGLDLSRADHQDILSETLGRISEYEHQQGRPLVSSMAIYKQTGDHGKGFYNLCHNLGIGSVQQLKARLYGFEEQARSREFWRDGENYARFYDVNGGRDAQVSSKGVAYFTQEELDFFDEWQSRPYDKADQSHVAAKNRIMETVWAKTIYLGNRIISELEGFQMEGKKVWSQRGWKDTEDGKVQAARFKHYTWIKIFRNTDAHKDIFFTFGLDADAEAFIYKIDCQNQRDSQLSWQQIELCKALIPGTAGWCELAYSQLLQKNWEGLVAVCVDFIQQNLGVYDAIVEAVWERPFQPGTLKNVLIKRKKPTDGLDQLPGIQRSFKGVHVDYEAQAKEQKDLGDAGEQLVKMEEIRRLERAGMMEEAKRVTIVKDGEGYDVLSFDEEGKEKYIEVKTTNGNKHTPFYLSENEAAFMRLNKDRYVIFRVYRYDAEHNCGEYFEVAGDVESQLLLQPVNYKVFLKKCDG